VQFTSTQGLPSPVPTDPAAGGPQVEALATTADTKVTGWDAFTGFGRTLRLATGITFGGATGFPVPPNTEQQVTFGTNPFDIGGMTTINSLILPQFNPRWWWYVGANVLMQAGAAVNTKFTVRIYVDDLDPGTGLTTRKVLTRNYYSPGAGQEEMFLDQTVLSGGGLVRVTITHQHTAGLDFVSPSVLFATQITPEG
jgi:hypothetical protein